MPRGDFGGKPAESPSERISLPADFSLEPRYDHEDPDVFHRMDFTPMQLEEIRRINNEEYINDNEVAEPFLTLTSSISYAENALERRLKQQIEDLHSVQLLRMKDVNELTDDDFIFLRQVVCADGSCDF